MKQVQFLGVLFVFIGTKVHFGKSQTCLFGLRDINQACGVLHNAPCVSVATQVNGVNEKKEHANDGDVETSYGSLSRTQPPGYIEFDLEYPQRIDEIRTIQKWENLEFNVKFATIRVGDIPGCLSPSCGLTTRSASVTSTNTVPCGLVGRYICIDSGTISPARTFTSFGEIMVLSCGELVCPDGSVSVQDCACSAGHFGSAGVCTPCLPGHFKSESGDGECIQCPPGKHAPLQGTRTCTDCPAGTYVEVSGALVCTICSQGKASSVVAASTPGVCVLCSAGKFKSDIIGTPCTDCGAGRYANMEGATVCTDCEAGSTGSNSADACVLCVFGTFKTVPGSAACTSCGLGKFSAVTGSDSNVCTCNAGSTGLDGTATCVLCNFGTYKVDAGSASCTACDAGKFSDVAGSISCTACGAGKFSDVVGSVSNVCACNAGSTGADGPDVCTSCDLGTYKAGVGPAACTNCGIGKFSTEMGSISNVCTCNHGWTGPDGEGFCTECISGMYKIGPGSAACTGCEAGKYYAATNPSSMPCETCRNNGYAPERSSSYEDCVCGLGASDNHIVYPHVMCSGGCPCPPVLRQFSGEIRSNVAGTNYANGLGCRWTIVSSRAISIQVTQFSTELNADYLELWKCNNPSSCNDIRIGKDSGTTVRTVTSTLTTNMHILFTSNANTVSTGFVIQWAVLNPPTAVECKLCAAGKYKDITGSAACSACNKPSTTVGANSDSCEACPVNSGNLSTTHGYCICDQGFRPSMSVGSNLGFSAGSGVYCNDCPLGTYKVITDQTCLNCEAGKYTAALGSAICQACPVNTVSAIASDEITDCVCNVGWTGTGGDSLCTACVAGKYKSSIGSAACENCIAGTDSTITGAIAAEMCLNCPLHKGALKEGDSAPVCACNAGTYKTDVSSALCTECGVGKFSAVMGSISNVCTCNAGSTGPDGAESCTPCVFGTYKMNSGSGACTECAAGKFYAVTDPFSVPCTLCASGTYKTDVSSALCTECGVGKFTAVRGSISNVCTCNAGSTGPDGAESCTPCVFGTYKLNSGSGACTGCAAGKFYAVTDPFSVPCESCITNTYAPEGSLTPNDCVCVAGVGVRLIQPITSVTCSGVCPCPAQLGQYNGQIRSNNAGTNYANNANCVWTIASNSPMSLSFSQHNMETNWDFVTISTCTNPSCGSRTQILRSTGSNIPSISAKSTAFRIVFTSDNVIVRIGFVLDIIYGTIKVCESCGAGKYKTDIGNVQCTDCLENQYSTAVASSSNTCQWCHVNSQSTPGSTNCMCNAGATGPIGGVCVSCVAGKYKHSSGSMGCTDCETGKYAVAAVSNVCEACPSNTVSAIGSDEITDCICNVGYDGPAGGTCTLQKCGAGSTGPDVGPCVPCVAGKYKGDIGSAECTNCVAGQYSIAVAAVSDICQNCHLNSVSAIGSDEITDCICNVGWTGSGGEAPCSACTPGTYKSSLGSDTCENCVAGTYSTSSNGITSDVCLSCPLNSNSAEASESPVDCICNAGFSGVRGELCTQCAVGKFRAAP